MISIDDSMVVQSFNVHLQTLGITRDILTIHGRYDKIQVCFKKKNGTDHYIHQVCVIINKDCLVIETQMFTFSCVFACDSTNTNRFCTI